MSVILYYLSMHGLKLVFPESDGLVRIAGVSAANEFEDIEQAYLYL